MPPEQFAGSANIGAALTAADRARMLRETELAVELLLQSLRVDYDRDPHLVNTPKRVARMLVEETLAGRYEPCPTLTDFPNATALDELYVVGPVSVRSTCAHHLAPIV